MAYPVVIITGDSADILQGKATMTQPLRKYVSEPFMKLTELLQDHDMQVVRV
jgi:hypothetical protein